MNNPLLDELQQRAANEWFDREQRLSHELLRPFHLLKPTISQDGNMWCVLYGENLQVGVAGFGTSPDLASRDFDKAWYQDFVMKP